MSNLRKSWSRFGVAFGEAFSTKGYVDLEQLIVETCVEGRKDSRLFFAMRGWVLKHHDFINGGRLIRMIKKTNETAMAGVLVDSILENEPRSGLQYVRKYCKPSAKREFAFEEIRESKVLGKLNEEENLPVWKKWNLISRDMEVMEGAIAEKGWVIAHNRNLALRAVFGAGIRAEILNFLLEYGKGSAYQIAASVNQSYEPIYSELRLCENIGFLKEEREGKAVVYHLRPAFLRKALKPLLAV